MYSSASWVTTLMVELRITDTHKHTHIYSPDNTVYSSALWVATLMADSKTTNTRKHTHTYTHQTILCIPLPVPRGTAYLKITNTHINLLTRQYHVFHCLMDRYTNSRVKDYKHTHKSTHQTILCISVPHGSLR